MLGMTSSKSKNPITAIFGAIAKGREQQMKRQIADQKAFEQRRKEAQAAGWRKANWIMQNRRMALSQASQDLAQKRFQASQDILERKRLDQAVLSANDPDLDPRLRQYVAQRAGLEEIEKPIAGWFGTAFGRKRGLYLPDKRKRAVQILTESGYPVEEENINALMDQLDE